MQHLAFILLSASSITSAVLGADPTFTLGPQSNYLKSAAITAHPSGTEILITPTDLSQGVPEAGADIFFGDLVRSKLGDTLNTACPSQEVESCVIALANDMNSFDTNSLEAETVGFEVPPDVYAAYVSYLYRELSLRDGKSPQPVSAIHLEAREISHLQIGSAATFAIASATSDASPITITSIAQPTLSVNATVITTLAADQDGHHKGDVIIRLAPDPAHELLRIINGLGGHSQCANITTRDELKKAGLVSGSNATLNNQSTASNASQTVKIGNITVDTSNFLSRANITGLLGHSNDANLTIDAGSSLSANATGRFSKVADKNSTSTIPKSAGNITASAIVKDASRNETSAQPNDIGHNTTLSGSKTPAEPLLKYGKSSINTAAILNDVYLVLPYAAPYALLRGLGLQGQNALPRMRDAILQGEIAIAQAAAAVMPGYEDWPSAVVNLIAETVYLAVWDVCAHASDDLQQIVLEEWMTEDPEDDEEPNQCPPISLASPVCQDTSCNGQNGVCTTGDNKDCDCLPTIEPVIYEMNKTDLDLGQQVIMEMLGVANTSEKYVNLGNLACGTATDQGNPLNFATLETMNKAANFFCTNLQKGHVRFQPGQVDQSDRATTLHYNNHENDPVFVALEWTDDDPNCPAIDFGVDPDGNAKNACLDRLGTIIDGCDTSNDKHAKNWKQGGTFFRDCITWSISRDTWTGRLPTNNEASMPVYLSCNSDEDCGKADTACSAPCGKDPSTSDVGWCACSSSFKKRAIEQSPLDS